MPDDDLLEELLQHSMASSPLEEEEMKKENLVLEPLLAEIDMINDHAIKLFVRSVLLNAEPIFWEAPASVSGEHHPPDERSAFGNVLHTKRVAHLAAFLSDAQDRVAIERDIAIAAALIHDISKIVVWQDGSLHYDKMHPYTADIAVRQLKDQQEEGLDPSAPPTQSSTVYIDDITYYQIMKCVRSHLGLFSPVPETYPTVSVEWIVHLADYIASHYHELIDCGEPNLARWVVTNTDE